MKSAKITDAMNRTVLAGRQTEERHGPEFLFDQNLWWYKEERKKGFERRSAERN